ncbi:MAG: hypothetical protein R3C11_18335 [Planctomycetaceae bacterium]
MSDDTSDSLESLPSRKVRRTSARKPARNTKAKPEDRPGPVNQADLPRRREYSEYHDPYTLQQKGAKVTNRIRTLFRHPPTEEEHGDESNGAIGGLSLVFNAIFGIAYLLFAHIRQDPNYSPTNREGLQQFILDMFKHVPRRDIYTREIRISEDNGEELRFLNNKKWNIKLPSRCIECGSREELQREKYFDKVEDFLWPFLGFVMGGMFSFVAMGLLSLYVSVSLWMLFLVLIASLISGLFLGYYLRTRTDVTVDYACCPEHTHNQHFPIIRQFSGDIYLLTGDKKVRDAYIKHLEKLGIKRR